VLLEEEFAVGAVGITLHHHGAVAQMREQERGNIGVVLQQIALGDGIFGPEELFEIGQMNRATVRDDVRLIGVTRDFDAAPASAGGRGGSL